MAIEREIPKDIKKYEPKLLGPFTTRQILCLVPGLGLGVLAYLLLKNFLSSDVCLFITTFIVVPFILLGWFKPYGLPFEKFVKTVFISSVLSPPIRKYKTKRLDDEPTDTPKKTPQKKKKKKKDIDPMFIPRR